MWRRVGKVRRKPTKENAERRRFQRGRIGWQLNCG
jgi:hypothetical protein